MLGAIFVFSVVVTMVTGQSQIQGLQVPPGSRVEVEVDFLTPRQGQQSGQQQQPTQQQQQQPTNQFMQQQQQQQQQQSQQHANQQQPMTRTGSVFVIPMSATQQLLNNMASMSMRMRSMTNVPVPNIEEPCPCDADCCQRPMDPRRLVPVLEVPMTMHYGCCGCIDCPISTYPMVGHMVMQAIMMDRASRRSTARPM